MLNLIITASLVGYLSLSLNAQGLKDKFFKSIGYTSILDFYGLPTQGYVTQISYNSNNKLVGHYSAFDVVGFSFLTIGGKFRYNIFDLSKNSSISIHVFPSIGLSNASGYDDERLLGSLSIPLMIGLNYGNVSTYSSDKNKGLGIAFGLEYFNGGLIHSSNTQDEIVPYQDINGNSHTYTSSTKAKTSFILTPAMELAYRYWNRNNKAKELALQISFKSAKLKADPIFDEVEISDPITSGFHIRLIWQTYFNY